MSFWAESVPNSTSVVRNGCSLDLIHYCSEDGLDGFKNGLALKYIVHKTSIFFSFRIATSHHNIKYFLFLFLLILFYLISIFLFHALRKKYAFMFLILDSIIILSSSLLIPTTYIRIISFSYINTS